MVFQLLFPPVRAQRGSARSTSPDAGFGPNDVDLRGIVTLQSPELASNSVQPWTARLRYAYADALLAAGRENEAREWFAKAVESDKDGSTDASDRLAELDGVEFVDALVEDEVVAADTEVEIEDEAEATKPVVEDDDEADDEDAPRG